MVQPNFCLEAFEDAPQQTPLHSLAICFSDRSAHAQNVALAAGKIRSPFSKLNES